MLNLVAEFRDVGNVDARGANNYLATPSGPRERKQMHREMAEANSQLYGYPRTTWLMISLDNTDCADIIRKNSR